jgi:DNA-binding transcriptional regulator YiaG
MDGAMTTLEAGEGKACEHCGGGPVTTSLETGQFSYGAGADGVVLSATVPVTRCAECDEAFTGEEGEILRHEAVCEHLGRLTPAQIATIRGERTIDEFAAIGGFDVDTVARWERGNRIQDGESDLVLRKLGA